MKVVMVMVILILALMTVIGAFLMNGVGNFYISEFYVQMEQTFSQSFIAQLQKMPEQSPDAPERMKELLMAQAGLGIDIANRNVYVLSPMGTVLSGSDQRTSVDVTPNLLAAMNGEVGQELEGLMEAAGMKCLAYYTRGPRYITSNRKITCVADCNNLVIRTPAAAMTVAAFEALGAKPTPMALAEVFTSLQQGTIEAQENPLAMIYTKSFFEVQKYLILTAHLRAWVYVAMGKAQFDALPAELQQVVMDGAAAAQAAEHQLFLDNEEKYYNELQEKGMEYVEVDTQEFADAMIGGVLPTLTDSQKKLYDKIAALA